MLLTAPLASADEVGPEVERLSSRFREPFFVDGFEIFASASIGVSFYPAHGQSYEILRAAADSAMYRVKESAKGGIRLFDANLSEAATARMEVEQRLRLAIRDRSLPVRLPAQGRLPHRRDRRPRGAAALAGRERDHPQRPATSSSWRSSSA